MEVTFSKECQNPLTSLGSCNLYVQYDYSVKRGLCFSGKPSSMVVEWNLCDDNKLFFIIDFFASVLTLCY